MRKIFLDIDNVFADFHGCVREVCGYEYETNPKAVWQVLDKIDGLFYWLKPIDGAVDMFHTIREVAYDAGLDDYNIEFLTALPLRTGLLMSASIDKADWVCKHLSEFARVNTVDHWSKKKYYCQAGDILIDDSIRNILDWDNAGGVAIHHVNQTDTITKLKEVLK